MTDMEWVLTLKPGDLAVGAISNQRGDKPHLLVLERSKRQEKERSKSKDEPEADWDAMWTARALCGAAGNAGNYRWYARPHRSTEPERGVCSRCLSKWKTRGKPVVRGWTDTPFSLLPRPAWLPFGWREAEPAGHPWDVPEGGDPELVVDDKGDVKGQQRVEVRRWVRGERYVRIVRYHGDEIKQPYGVYDGWSAYPLGESHETSGSAERAVTRAVEQMASGGSPRNY